MNWRRYFVVNAASGIVWSAIFTWASYAAENTLHHVSGTLNVVLLGVAGAILVVSILLVRRKVGDLVETAEELYPDLD